MGELGLNKIFGALLAVALGMMALIELPKIVFGGSGYGSGRSEAATLSERMCEQFSYCIEIAEAAGPAGIVEAAFDLGAALFDADLARGERLFTSQCLTCHTINPGGANGTGPNLHNTVGATKAHIAGFNYSAALANMDGAWTYENLDDWLRNPAGYLRGTSMSFAGIRRDNDRAAVIAYLAANTENPPAFPAPMPAAQEITDEAVETEDTSLAIEGDVVETGIVEAADPAAPAETPAEPATETEALPEETPTEE